MWTPLTACSKTARRTSSSRCPIFMPSCFGKRLLPCSRQLAHQHQHRACPVPCFPEHPTVSAQCEERLAEAVQM